MSIQVSRAALLSATTPFLGLSVLGLVLSGCTGSPTEPDSPGQRRTAIEIVTSTSCQAPLNLSLPVLLDGAQVALLGVPGDVTVDTTAGSHVLRVGTLVSQPVVVQAGATARVCHVFAATGCAQ